MPDRRREYQEAVENLKMRSFWFVLFAKYEGGHIMEGIVSTSFLVRRSRITTPRNSK